MLNSSCQISHYEHMKHSLSCACYYTNTRDTIRSQRGAWAHQNGW